MTGRSAGVRMLVAILVGATLAAPPAAAAQPSATDWSDPATVWSSPRGWERSSTPQMIVDSRGIVTAIWLARTRTKARVMAARTQGGLWRVSTLSTLAVPPTTYRESHVSFSLAVSDNDDVIAVWALDIAPDDAMRDTWSVQAAAFTSGAWQPAATLVDDPDTSILDLQIVGGTDGATVLWQSAPGATQYTSSITAFRFAAGSWSPPAVLDDAAALTTAQLVRESVSDARAVWSNANTIVSAAASERGWSARETIALMPSPLSGALNVDLDAAGDGQGGSLVAWREADNVKAALHTSAGWSTPSVVDQSYAGDSKVSIIESVSLAGGASVVIGRPVLKCCYDATVYRLGGEAWTASPTLQARSAYMTGSRWTLLGPEDGLVADVENGSGWTRAPAPAATQRMRSTTTVVAPDGSLLLAFLSGSKAGPYRTWSTTLRGTEWAPVEPIPISSRGSRQAARGHGFVIPAVGPDGRITAMWSDGSALRAVRSR